MRNSCLPKRHTPAQSCTWLPDPRLLAVLLFSPVHSTAASLLLCADESRHSKPFQFPCTNLDRVGTRDRNHLPHGRTAFRETLRSHGKTGKTRNRRPAGSPETSGTPPDRGSCLILPHCSSRREPVAAPVRPPPPIRPTFQQIGMHIPIPSERRRNCRSSLRRLATRAQPAQLFLCQSGNSRERFVPQAGSVVSPRPFHTRLGHADIVPAHQARMPHPNYMKLPSKPTLERSWGRSHWSFGTFGSPAETCAARKDQVPVENIHRRVD